MCTIWGWRVSGIAWRECDMTDTPAAMCGSKGCRPRVVRPGGVLFVAWKGGTASRGNREGDISAYNQLYNCDWQKYINSPRCRYILCTPTMQA